jgi:hypothetical protein
MFFAKKTVADIIGPITKIVKDLEAHAGVHLGKAWDHDDKAAEHLALANEARTEHRAALAQADKIKEIIA